MVSQSARVSLRLSFALLLLFVSFYVGRPLYWKLSATIHDIREKKQTVKEGITQLVHDAQKSVGWFHDEFDSGVIDDPSGTGGKGKVGEASNRRILRFLNSR